MTLTIYGCYRSRATRTVWLANELGLSFKHVPVIQAYRLAAPEAADAPLHTRSAGFLDVNPNGHIPSIDDDGFVLHESLAINLYLARKHGGPLSGRTLAEEGQITTWTMWAATAVEPHAVKIILTLDERAADSEQGRLVIRAATKALKKSFAVLDAHLAGREYISADYSIADIACFPWVMTHKAQQLTLDDFSHVRRWFAAMRARPAVQRGLAVGKELKSDAPAMDEEARKHLFGAGPA